MPHAVPKKQHHGAGYPYTMGTVVLLVRVPTEEKTECRSVYDAGLQTTVVKKILQELCFLRTIFSACLHIHS